MMCRLCHLSQLYDSAQVERGCRPNLWERVKYYILLYIYYYELNYFYTAEESLVHGMPDLKYRPSLFTEYHVSTEHVTGFKGGRFYILCSYLYLSHGTCSS